MITIIEKYEKKYGYMPTIKELYNLYIQGELRLTDHEENTLIKEFNKTNELWNTKLKENQ